MPLFLTIMVKHEAGCDGINGDWECQSSPNGDLVPRGPASSPVVRTVCGECHANVPERDFIFATVGQGSK